MDNKKFSSFSVNLQIACLAVFIVGFLSLILFNLVDCLDSVLNNDREFCESVIHLPVDNKNKEIADYCKDKYL